MRVADGALSAAKCPGRATTDPIAESVCVNGSTLAFAVDAATTGGGVFSPASLSSAPFFPQPASSASAPHTANIERESARTE
jgi:hypothetical protein